MISVGIPAYNEEKSISKTISSVLPQLQNSTDEIIVIASGCNDNTISVCKKINDQRIKIIEEKTRSGKVAALNKIFSEAKNEIIVQTDADVILHPYAISNLVKHFNQNKKIGAVSGKICNYKLENFFDKIQNFGWLALNDQKISENNKGTFYALNGYLVAVKKSATSKLDETSLVDDAILGWTVKKNGYQVIYEPCAKVYVQAAQNISDYIKQKSRVRTGWWQMTRSGMKLGERRNAKQLKYLYKNLYAWPYIALDFLIWIKAYRDFKKKKLIWDKISSSKI